jgi:hypothetical protein
MDFTYSKNRLLKILGDEGFEEHLKKKELYAHDIIVDECSNGTKIHMVFPGKKAKVKEGKLIYDYRVDIEKDGVRTTLSHANLITDIANKCLNCSIDKTKFKELLIQEAQETDFDIHVISRELKYNPIAPPTELLNSVKGAHGSKFYNKTGNSFDFEIEELFKSMKWVVLQEDINYPMPKYEGRKMPFARYIETVFVTETTTHSLAEVIQRALAHFRPVRWNDMDYSFLSLVNSSS